MKYFSQRMLPEPVNALWDARGLPRKAASAGFCSASRLLLKSSLISRFLGRKCRWLSLE